MNIKSKITALISLIVCIVVVMGICIPILSSTTNDDDPGWMYDDYKSIEGVEIAEGSLEMITVGSNTYIHAKDVGEGTITYSNGDVENITVKKAKLDVIYLYGQSNASYRNGNISEVDSQPPMGTTYFYGYEDAYGPSAALNNTGFDISDCDMYSLYDSDGVLRVGGILPSFSYNYNKITDHKVYLIDGAIGNKSILTFDPPSGFMWTYGESILDAGLSEIDTTLYDYSCKYYMWIQGEADSGRDIDVYKERFMEMHTALLDGEMSGIYFQKCFMSKVRESNGVNSSIAQLQLAEEHPNTIEIVSDVDSFTVANGLMGSDNLHYSQKGNNIVGERFGVALGEAENPTYELKSTMDDIIGIIPIILISALILTFVTGGFLKNKL